MLERHFRPRAIISYGIYGTFLYLCVIDETVRKALVPIVSALMTFYYSQKLMNGSKNNNAANKQ